LLKTEDRRLLTQDIGRQSPATRILLCWRLKT